MDTNSATTIVQIYTDGACKGNPGIGGWAAILYYNNNIKEISGVFTKTTNNRMELQAAIEGIRILTRSCIVQLYTDSKYVQLGMTKWIHNWQHTNWKNIKNSELWQELLLLSQRHIVEWYWIKGHSGHSQNERADELANIAIAQYLQ